jgi:hypothetical protein
MTCFAVGEEVVVSVEEEEVVLAVVVKVGVLVAVECTDEQVLVSFYNHQVE